MVLGKKLLLGLDSLRLSAQVRIYSCLSLGEPWSLYVHMFQGTIKIIVGFPALHSTTEDHASVVYLNTIPSTEQKEPASNCCIKKLIFIHLQIRYSRSLLKHIFPEVQLFRLYNLHELIIITKQIATTWWYIAEILMWYDRNLVFFSRGGARKRLVNHWWRAMVALQGWGWNGALFFFASSALWQGLFWGFALAF